MADDFTKCVRNMSKLILKEDETSENKKSGKKSNILDRNEDGFEKLLFDFIKDINFFGIFVVDKFLGNEKGMEVFSEVMKLHEEGVFKDGQLVRNNSSNNTIRGDQITWITGAEDTCKHIGELITAIDRVVLNGNKMKDNGELGKYKVDGRTKAMVACYPGRGTQYVLHVDNPNKDGRCITAIYYLNTDWVKEHGGLLRIFPTGLKGMVAEIEPRFDRMLFFWSDRRNPHEVLPSFRTRYAITIWYFDAIERSESRMWNKSKVKLPDRKQSLPDNTVNESTTKPSEENNKTTTMVS